MIPAGAAVAIVNAGSSSIKFRLYAVDDDEPTLLLRGEASGIGGEPRFFASDARGATLADRRPGGAGHGHDAALAEVLCCLREHRGPRRLVAVGHRVVHGGTRFCEPVRVDEAVLAELEALVPLAPLHQPHNLAAIRALAAFEPGLPQVACFDTAFHRSNPPVAQRYALPAPLFEAGVRRYGFHGLSCEYIASVLPRFDEAAARGRTVVCHLGNGASLCALDDGRSVASSMGFSTLDGIPMGTRPGALDPGVLLYLMTARNMDAAALEQLLYRESGLLGLSGLSSDMRTLLASDEPGAALAIDVFVHRVGREIGSLAAALGGLDALVFTAGIGEHAVPIRARICRAAEWLGLAPDEAANAAGGPRISVAGSRVSAWVIPTDEEGMIARHTVRLLGGAGTARAR